MLSAEQPEACSQTTAFYYYMLTLPFNFILNPLSHILASASLWRQLGQCFMSEDGNLPWFPKLPQPRHLHNHRSCGSHHRLQIRLFIFLKSQCTKKSRLGLSLRRHLWILQRTMGSLPSIEPPHRFGELHIFHRTPSSRWAFWGQRSRNILRESRFKLFRGVCGGLSSLSHGLIFVWESYATLLGTAPGKINERLMDKDEFDTKNYFSRRLTWLLRGERFGRSRTPLRAKDTHWCNVQGSPRW